MAIEWRIQVQGKTGTYYGSRLHVAVHRALVGYPLPAVGEVVAIRARRTEQSHR